MSYGVLMVVMCRQQVLPKICEIGRSFLSRTVLNPEAFGYAHHEIRRRSNYCLAPSQPGVKSLYGCPLAQRLRTQRWELVRLTERNRENKIAWWMVGVDWGFARVRCHWEHAVPKFAPPKQRFQLHLWGAIKPHRNSTWSIAHEEPGTIRC